MNTKHLLFCILLSWAFAPASAQSLTLFDNPGSTANFTGSNATTYVNFMTPLPNEANTLDKWEVGYSISMSFNLSYTGFLDTTGDSLINTNFDFGFISSSANATDSVAYVVVQPISDYSSAAGSTFRYRNGSVFMSDSASGVQVPGTDAFDSSLMFTGDPTDGGSFNITFTVLKSGVDAYDFLLDIGDSSFLETGALDASVTGSVIDQIGFRLSHDHFENGLAEDITATFAIPEPSTYGLLAASAIFVGVLFQRRRKNG